MNVSWEGVALVLGAIGTIIAGFWKYREQAQADRLSAAQAELATLQAREKTLQEREQTLNARYDAQFSLAQKRIEELENDWKAEKDERRKCESLILEMQRQMATLQRQVDRLSGNGGAKHE